MADAFLTEREHEDKVLAAYADTEIDRQNPRCELLGSVPATIFPPADQPGEPVACAVLARDLSPRGFGIAHTAAVGRGQRIDLEMPAETIRGEVLWCRQVRPGCFIIGCRRTEGG